MSMDKELNTLSEIHYRHEFGERKLYRLKFSDEKVKSERDDKQGNFHSQWLFGKDVTYTKLASMLSKKARIKITNITDSYSFEQYKADNKQFVPLYTVDKEGKLHVITDKFDGTVPRDRKLVSLVVDDDVQPKPVDVTPKQEQARAVADASFESDSKAPEKRQEIELADDDSDVEEASLINNDKDAEQNLPNDVSADASLASNPSSTMPIALNDEGANEKIATSESASTSQVNPEVLPANPNMPVIPKTASSSKNSGNGNGSAPKNKNGSLDPNRLPDSGQDKAAKSNTAEVILSKNIGKND